MSENTKDLDAIESELAALEAPKQRFLHAKQDLDTLRSMAVPANERLQKMHADMVATAEADLVEAEAAYEKQRSDHKKIGLGSLTKNIDVLSQAVLDGYGEKHTDQAYVGGPEHVG